MKKTAFIVFMLLSLLSVGIRQGYCETESEPVDKEQLLVSLDKSQVEDRIRELDRRVDDLEREKNFQDERVRNLERTVNDLRRERN